MFESLEEVLELANLKACLLCEGIGAFAITDDFDLVIVSSPNVTRDFAT